MNTYQTPQTDLERLDSTLRTRYWTWTFLDPTTQPRLLVDVLREHLPHIDEQSWAERFDFGGVYINGQPVIADTVLPHPCRVEYYEPKFEIARAAEQFPRFDESFIVFRDSHLAVVYKPPKLPSMPAKEQRHFSLKASVEKALGKSIHMPSRLDVSAQGLVVVSINDAGHRSLQQMFERRCVHKVYRLLTDRDVDWQERVVEASIGRDPRHPVLRRTVASGGQQALTRFSRFTRSGPSGALVTAEPVTGRTHQIRVHAAFSGIPIIGDSFYGGAAHSHLHLLSYSISLDHPVNGRAISIELPEPLRPAWLEANPARRHADC